jgi:hypothetical protein
MALVVADRVKETTTVTGTGGAGLLGAVTGYQSFSSGVGVGNSTYYCIAAQSGSEWEVGIGTLAPGTLTRTTILASSNSGSPVSFSAGTKDIFCTYPAARSVNQDGALVIGAFNSPYTDGLVMDYVHPNGRISVGASDGIQFYNNGAGGTLLGSVSAGGNWDLNGSLVVGTGAPIAATNPLIEAAGNVNGYVQAYINNNSTGTDASADIACYPNNGTDTSGWIDMGITGSNYASATYPITLANEGYIFMSAPSGAGKTGNLVYATDSTGSTNYHQWYVGGFGVAKASWQMQLSSTTLDLKVTLQPIAGTTTVAPLKFTSGTNLTTAAAGAMEYDGKVFYGTHVANSRGTIPTEQFCCSTSTLTLGNNTTLQKVFNTSTNGALTVAAATTYFFECMLNLSSMSGTSGNMGFSIVGAGTATFTSAGWQALGVDATTLTTAAAAGGSYSASQTATGNIVTAQTGTAVTVLIKGIFRINAGGTIIPSVQLTNAAAAVVGVNSWFKCTPVGTNTVTTVGNWS